MIARINELPNQCLRSSLFQRWLQMTAANIFQPGSSCQEAFLYLSLGQVEPWCCRVAILGLLVFFLELCIFPCFFPFEYLSCQFCLSHQPYLCSFTLFLYTALFCAGFSSSCHQASRFLRSLSWGCTNIAGSRITDSWTAGRRVTGTTGCSGKLLTFSYEEPSLLLSDHVAVREQRAATHT